MIEIIRDLLNVSPIIPILIAAGTACYTIFNLYTTLKKSRKIEKKLSAEERQIVSKKLTFDPITGELVLKNLYEQEKKPDEVVVDQIYKDGFLGREDASVIQNGSKNLQQQSVGEDDLQHLYLIDNYYSQALNQSKVSFWFSLAGASIGFFVIILSIFLYQDDRNGVALFSLISGVVIEGVSVLFFTQTNRDQKRRSEFFENLRKDKLYKESVALCNSVSDIKSRDALKIQIALNFAGVSDSIQVANTIIQKNLTVKNK